MAKTGNPFHMFFKKITGRDLTKNQAIPNTSDFASQATRNFSLDKIAGGDQSAYFGNNDNVDFVEPADDLAHAQKDLVEKFNSRLDLQHDLPSTQQVNRFNAQNKG